MRRAVYLIIVFLFSTGCDQKSPYLPGEWETIDGRDSSEESLIIRRPVYRARVPKEWTRVTPSPEISLIDTTLPLVEYWIEDEIHITLHNFPFKDLKQRIPPRAQVARWQKQLISVSSKEVIIQPISHNGYAGLYFEGNIDDKQVMAWALNLDQEHIRSLSKLKDPSNQVYIEQMQADVTIKVAGPPDLCEIYREDIISFATSFELIQEIPELR